MELSDKVAYNDSLELILSREAEKCLALRWSHDQAQRWTAARNSWIMIPSIVLSSLASAGSFGGSGLLPFEGADKLIGFISLAVATINTVGSYYGFSKRSESHRVAALLYGRLHRWLTFQLSIPRAQRIAAGDLLKVVKEEGDRLNEISPQLPTAIIALFKRQFAGTETAVPEILNGLDKVGIFKEPEVVKQSAVKVSVISV
jgi:hypothetical protein